MDSKIVLYFVESRKKEAGILGDYVHEFWERGKGGRGGRFEKQKSIHVDGKEKIPIPSLYQTFSFRLPLGAWGPETCFNFAAIKIRVVS